MVDVVSSSGLWREVVKLSAVDFPSGETLIDTLVLPTAKVKHWKTDLTGITQQTLSEAKLRGCTVKGWREARALLWRYVDTDTILVGQALENDLEVLGMLHARVVDSAILAAEAIGLPGARTCGLKTLCKELLNVDVQSANGGIHECLEDALAAREVVLHFIRQPKEVQTWALAKKKEELERQAGREREKGRVSGRRGRLPAFLDLNEGVDDVADDDIEVCRWEDIAEDLGWPHPDTGYEPDWSD